jgi:hypothetical protein
VGAQSTCALAFHTGVGGGLWRRHAVHTGVGGVPTGAGQPRDVVGEAASQTNDWHTALGRPPSGRVAFNARVGGARTGALAVHTGAEAQRTGR